MLKRRGKVLEKGLICSIVLRAKISNAATAHFNQFEEL